VAIARAKLIVRASVRKRQKWMAWFTASLAREIGNLSGCAGRPGAVSAEHPIRVWMAEAGNPTFYTVADRSTGVRHDSAGFEFITL
jgi:hypothetical protein